MIRRILAFIVVGTIGFIIDGGIVTLAVEVFKLNPYLSRAISFPLAVTATWYLNRKWAFATNATSQKKTEYTRYFIIQIIGALINLAIYSLLIANIPLFAVHPILPLAIGSLIAMTFNFLGAQLFVFNRKHEPEDSVTAK